MFVELPTAAVRLMNALFWQIPDLSAEFEAFRAIREDARQWLQESGNYSTCDEEAQLLANISYLWDDADAALQLERHDEMLERLLPALAQAVTLRRTVERERSRAASGRDVSFRDFILSGNALFQGRAPQAAFTERVPRARAVIDLWANLFGTLSPRLAADVRASAEAGFLHMQQALDLVEQALQSGDRATLERGLALFSLGAEQVEPFLEWQEDWDRATAEEHARFDAIPLRVGSNLDELLHNAAKTDRAGWAFGMRRARKLVHGLERFWEEARNKVLLPRSDRDALVGEVDTCLQALSVTVARFADQRRSADELLQSGEEALKRLDEAFRRLREHALNGDSLPAPAAVRLDAGLGVLRETCPVVILQQLQQAEPLPPPFGEAEEKFTSYLETGDPFILQDALETLVRCAPSDDGPRAEQPVSVRA